jgi:HEAT repeat protein
MPAHPPSHRRSEHASLAEQAQRIGQIAQLLRELAGSEQRNDCEAEKQLRECAPTAGELVALSRDRNPFIRAGAVWWVRNLQGELPASVVDALHSAASDVNPHVVQAALGSAGVLRLSALREDAIHCLSDSNPAVVHSAIFALGRIGPTEMGRLIVPFLRAREQHLEKAALNALIALHYRPAIAELLHRLESFCGATRKLRGQFELPRLYLQALASLQATEAVPLLLRIASEEVGLRGLAVQTLIDLRAEVAGPALLPLLERLRHCGHEEKLCCRLIRLMLTVDYRFAIPTVRGFLEHRLPRVRITALRALARWQDRAAIPAIRRLIRDDPSAFVRPEAVTALAELAPHEALTELPTLTEDANPLVRAAVADAALRLAADHPEANAILDRLACDKASGVVRQLEQAQPRPRCSEECLPAGLHQQAPAARAFLRYWQTNHNVPPEVRQALSVVLDALRAA